MNALTRPKITATIEDDGDPLCVVSPPANRMPGDERFTGPYRESGHCGAHQKATTSDPATDEPPLFAMS